jgi:NADH-ubiquinone oxidoreductase chain 1
MTEHSASIFVFFFLGEYSSLILMSAFMSIFFLGGYLCPNLHNIVLDPFLSVYYYFTSFDLSHTLYMLGDVYYQMGYVFNLENNSKPDIEYLNFESEILESYSKEYKFYQFASILIDKIYGSYIFGLKIVIVVFFFIWVRASMPRMRYDQLMSFCWKELLPLVFGYIILSISLFSTFDLIPYGTGF